LKKEKDGRKLDHLKRQTSTAPSIYRERGAEASGEGSGKDVQPRNRKISIVNQKKGERGRRACKKKGHKGRSTGADVRQGRFPGKVTRKVENVYHGQSLIVEKSLHRGGKRDEVNLAFKNITVGSSQKGGNTGDLRQEVSSHPD